MEPVVNGGIIVPVNTQDVKHNLKSKVAFKQDMQMAPALQQDQFSSMPMVYEPDVEPKKKSSSANMILGAVALLTTGLALWKHKKIGALQEENALLMKKGEEITAKATEAEKKLQNVGEVFNEMKPGDRFGKNRVGKGVWAKLKAALEGAGDDAKKVADEAKEVTEKAVAEGAATGEKLTGEEAAISAAQAAAHAG